MLAVPGGADRGPQPLGSQRVWRHPGAAGASPPGPRRKRGLNDITFKAAPGQAIELVRAAENGELDEAAIAARLAEFSGRNSR